MSRSSALGCYLAFAGFFANFSLAYDCESVAHKKACNSISSSCS